jgi:hypothetical protein
MVKAAVARPEMPRRDVDPAGRREESRFLYQPGGLKRSIVKCSRRMLVDDLGSIAAPGDTRSQP